MNKDLLVPALVLLILVITAIILGFSIMHIMTSNDTNGNLFCGLHGKYFVESKYDNWGHLSLVECCNEEGCSWYKYTEPELEEK